MYRFKTFLLMTLLTVIFIILGGAIAGEGGLFTAFIFALVLNFISYWYSDRIAIKMTKSKPLPKEKAPNLHRMIEDLSRKADLPKPDVYITPSNQPNAFATGRSPNKAAIALTEGIMDMLDKEELEGVIAHELSHIKNRDTLISTLAAVMAGALAFIARLGRYRMLFGRRNKGAGALLQIAALIFAPLAAIIVKMAISRTREYKADARAAEISGRPDGLASALEKMERYMKSGGENMEVNEATSHMFILNPLSSEGISKLFSSHPPTEDRITRLRQMR
ncbi:zinc metalloprotease HtpX [Halarsenatibacter silvermanii]|uniref:Protease HtpX homolog n=1 Tax=Halarsenatibacter silvermanii TaxID=321763 RepID=A0A1G9SQC5_9FIRM|nr:zinc metalloprotease HtpX [Halarsenatibacter silvermanii]SDM37668.1 Heat shock protein. Metallo peptidase. MEROPS family M48B [Halarsenatibacter silvermanii]